MSAVKRETFGSRSAVILTMAGSAIGLGNIWRFPYMVGEHGGGAFIVLYIISTLLISLPVFVAEATLGRRSRTSAYGAMARLAPGKPFWKSAGILAVIIPTVIASYYSVIGGWSLEYLFQSATAAFVRNDPERVSALFGTFISSPFRPVAMHLLFLAACAYIVGRGVKSGIERFSKITIPILFVLIVAIAVYSISLPGARAGVAYLVRPDFSQLTARSFAFAMGQSFYSLSLGMGAIITYGSYVSREENLLVSSAGTAVSDLLFAILAGFAIMPVVFAAGIEPGAGPGLVFQSIPYVFSVMGEHLPVISTIVSVVFFVAIIVAAMTSLISLLEVGVSYLVERHGVRRPRACMLLFLVCGGVGVLCSLSFGPLAGMKVAGLSLFDLLDWLSSNILLPVLAFLVVIFVGRVLKREDLCEELSYAHPGNARLFGVVYFLIKWVAPIAVALLFVTNFIL